MRALVETIGAHPTKRFTYAELAALAYPGEPVTHERLMAIGNVVRRLEKAASVSTYRTEGGFKTVSKRLTQLETLRALLKAKTG